MRGAPGADTCHLSPVATPSPRPRPPGARAPRGALTPRERAVRTEGAGLSRTRLRALRRARPPRRDLSFAPLAVARPSCSSRACGVALVGTGGVEAGTAETPSPAGRVGARGGRGADGAATPAVARGREGGDGLGRGTGFGSLCLKLGGAVPGWRCLRLLLGDTCGSPRLLREGLAVRPEPPPPGRRSPLTCR